MWPLSVKTVLRFCQLKTLDSTELKRNVLLKHQRATNKKLLESSFWSRNVNRLRVTVTTEEIKTPKIASEHPHDPSIEELPVDIREDVVFEHGLAKQKVEKQQSI